MRCGFPGSRFAVAIMLFVVQASMLDASEESKTQSKGGEWVVPAQEKTKTAPMFPTPEGIERGRALYLKHCATCHGDTGRGDGPLSRLHTQRTSRPPYDLTDPVVQSVLADGEIFWKISSGYRAGDKVIMPAFAAKVPSEEDRWRIVQFVRTLGQTR